MSEIVLKSYDFGIGEYEGSEVVQLRAGLAFDPSFIEEMKEKGVKKIMKRDQQGDNTDTSDIE